MDEFRSFATDQFNTSQDLDVGVVKIVDNNDFVAGYQQGENREGTDVARAAVIPSISQLG